ncbi:hypothetical protein V6N11_045545 [Hibiscus sabdariffa]|uniref:BED-type domain-containing protein n=1 Tax=Hibiscus sabdariffa TaxID=183260 RepID=A0ABR2Q1W1_9ROSI
MSSNLEPIPITSQKHDPAWKHCQMFKNGEKVQLRCVYCGKIFKGGGIHRIKEHLAGHKGNAATCLHVPSDVRVLMKESLDGVVVKKRKKQKIAEEITDINQVSTETNTFSDQVDANTAVVMIDQKPDTDEPSSSLLVIQEGTSNVSGVRRRRGKGKSSATEANAFSFAPDELSARRVNNNVHMAIGRFLFDIGASLDAVNSVYFQPMIDAIISGGNGTLMPSRNDLQGWILKKSVEEVKSDNEKVIATWKQLAGHGYFTGVGRLSLFKETRGTGDVGFSEQFFYSMEGDMPNEMLSGMLDCIEKLVPDVTVQDKISKEINSYKNAAGDLGRKMAIRARDTLLPAEWWSTYGGSCPNLARNCLEQQRLRDLIFVQCNLQLRQIGYESKQQDSAQPISFESASVVEDWVTGIGTFLDDNTYTDWTTLETTTLLRPSCDEMEELGAGFDDHEIFNRVKEGNDENAENVVDQLFELCMSISEKMSMNLPAASIISVHFPLLSTVLKRLKTLESGKLWYLDAGMHDSEVAQMVDS